MIRVSCFHRISLTTVAVLLVGAATVLSQGDDMHLSLNGNIGLAQPSGWQLVLREPQSSGEPLVYESIETIGAWGTGLSFSYPIIALLELRTGVWFDVQRYTIEHVTSTADQNGSSTMTAKSFGSTSSLTIPVEAVMRFPIVNSSSTVIVGAGVGWYVPMSDYAGTNTTSVQTDSTSIMLDPESSMSVTGRFGVRSMIGDRTGMEFGLLMTAYPLTDHVMEIISRSTVHSVRQSFTQIRLYAAFDLQFGG